MTQQVTYLPQKRPAPAKVKLIEAGVRLFTKQEGRGLTARELAREAKVNHALISYHFGSLSELLAEVVRRCIEDLRSLFLPQVEAFEAEVRAAEAKELVPLLHKHVTVLFKMLAGPKGKALLKAFATPDVASLPGVYGLFAGQVLMPLHHSFAVTAAKMRMIDEKSLEAAVIGQCMTAQCMAFFRGAPTVLKYLDKASFSGEEDETICRTVAEALARTGGPASEVGMLAIGDARQQANSGKSH